LSGLSTSTACFTKDGTFPAARTAACRLAPVALPATDEKRCKGHENRRTHDSTSERREGDCFDSPGGGGMQPTTNSARMCSLGRCT
jgi:hypothetical protein